MHESIDAQTASKDNKSNFHGLMEEVSVNMFILPEHVQCLFLLQDDIVALERLKPHARTVFLGLHV